MASAIYPLTLIKLLNPGTLGTTVATSVDFTDDNIKCSLVRTAAYTYSAAHEFLSSAATRVADSANLGTKTVGVVAAGVFDAADVTFTAVGAGAAIDAILIWKDTTSAATSSLIAYIDGITVTPNGGDITVQWNASGILAI